MSEWKDFVLAGLAIALGASLLNAGAKGAQVATLEMEKEILRLELSRTLDENQKLGRAAQAVGQAGLAQTAALAADMERREEIGAIMAVCTPEAARPKGVIDDETSRKIILFFNAFNFDADPSAGHVGLRRDAPAGSFAAEMSGPASAAPLPVGPG